MLNKTKVDSTSVLSKWARVLNDFYVKKHNKKYDNEIKKLSDIIFYLLCAFLLQPLIYIFVVEVFDPDGLYFIHQQLRLIMFSYWGFPALAFNPILLLICLSRLAYVKYKRANVESFKVILNTIKKSYKHHIELFLLAFILLWAIIAFPFSSNLRISLFGYPFDRGGLLGYFYLAIVFISVWTIKKEYKKRKLINAFLVFSSIMGILVLCTHAFGIIELNSFLYKYSGIFRNTNFYGYFLSIMVIVSAGMYYTDDRFFPQLLYLLSFMLSIVLLMLNNTISANMAVLFGIVFLVIAFSISRRKFSYKSIVIIFTFISVFTIMEATGISNVANGYIKRGRDIDIVQNPTEYSQEDIDNVGINVRERKDYLLQGIDMIKTVPIYGNGNDCYFSYSKYNKRYNMPHNEFIQLGANVGVPALIAYFLALAVIYIKSVVNNKKLKDSQIIGLSAAGAYIVSSIFGNYFSFIAVYYVIFLSMAINSDFKIIKDKTGNTEINSKIDL